ncbi:MAG: hypothetical protein KW802_00030 [Candidatus Doudnabacteria bacterium]|nr:hypothetical protein [Candidatus Doudnabacteria bacterium]
MKAKILSGLLLVGMFTLAISVNFAHAAVPEITRFEASHTSINAGESVTITWATMNGRNASLYPVNNSAPLSGTVTVTPLKSTTYLLIVRGFDGYDSQRVTVNVNADQSIQASFVVNKSTINHGESATLSWTTNADIVDIEPDIGLTVQSGSVNVTPAKSATYQLIAQQGGSWISKKISVTVVPAPAPAPLPPVPQPTPEPAITYPGRPAATTLRATCVGTGGPQVLLEWDPVAGQTANSLQKRIRGGDWTWLYQDLQPFSRFYYVDRIVNLNTTYEYRVKTDYLSASAVIPMTVTPANCK